MKVGIKVAIVLIPIIVIVVIGLAFELLTSLSKAIVSVAEESINSLCVWAGR